MVDKNGKTIDTVKVLLDMLPKDFKPLPNPVIKIILQ
jgi:hypothetical protein